MTSGPNEKHIIVRVDTFRAVEQIRLDESFKTYDAIIREMVRRVFPQYAQDL